MKNCLGNISPVFKNLLKNNKYELLSISSLFIIFIMFIIVFKGNIALLDCDFSKEAYIPARILQGKLLYKDIYIPYPPFSFIINTVYYSLFGASLNTIFIIGPICSFFVLSGIYLVSRTVSSIYASWITTFFIMSSLCFLGYSNNYLYPYCFAAEYAILGLIFAALFSCLFIKNSRPCFLYLAFFFLGLSFASKLDFTTVLFPLTLLTLIRKKTSKINLLVCMLFFMLIPVISFSILMFKGLSVSDALYPFLTVNASLTSKYTLFIFKHIGSYPSKEFFVANIYYFLNFLTYFFITSSLIYFVLYYLNLTKIKKNIPVLLLKILLISIIIFFFPYTFIAKISKPVSFSWIPVTTLLISFYLGYKIFLKKTNYKDIILFFLAIVGTLTTIRCFFFSVTTTAKFFLPVALIVNIVFIFDYLANFAGNKINKVIPEEKRGLNKKLIHLSCFIVLLLISFNFAKDSYTFKERYTLKTDKGLIYTDSGFQYAYTQALDYINTNISKESSVLVIPEAPLLNFLTGRESLDRYYSLTPSTMDVLGGEVRVLSGLKSDPPDYIFISDKDTSECGPKKFEDYAKKILNFIKTGYSLQAILGKDYKFKVYKRNN